jgi:hypothetical protein
MPWEYPPQRPPCPHRPPKSKNKNVNNFQKYSKAQESGLRNPPIPNPLKRMSSSRRSTSILENSLKHTGNFVVFSSYYGDHFDLFESSDTTESGSCFETLFIL